MAHARTIALGTLITIAIAACDSGLAPTAPAAGDGTPPPGATATADGSAAADRSAAVDPDAVSVARLAARGRVNPILVDDSRIAIVSDACAAAARPSLGEVEANLPTAM